MTKSDIDLKTKRVAILATDGFEQSELLEPLRALKDAGVQTTIVSLKTGKIKGWDAKNWGKEIEVELLVSEADAKDFDALVLPGGVMNPDALRVDKDAIRFIREFNEEGKTIAAICHGPWTLIEAGAVDGRKMTSWPSLQTDLRNAGASWSDEKVVVDGHLITSRKPDDLPAFNEKIIAALASSDSKESRHKDSKSAETTIQ